MKSFLLVITGMLCMSFAQCAAAGTFGSGLNTFDIDFVTIGNPGNTADTTGSPNPAGSVSYSYGIGKFEISEQMIDKANTLGGLGITKILRGPDKPATSVSWNEAVRFINWLNTSAGSTPAYKFALQPGEAGYSVNANIELWTISDSGYNPNNLYRNSLAKYFLPSVDEWYKAAYNAPSGVYFDYPTGSDSAPTAVASGTTAGTAVYDFQAGPADITLAGGLSPYGTMGQGGNAWELEETDTDLLNDSSSSVRQLRGGGWSDNGPLSLASHFFGGAVPSNEEFNFGFRVATSYLDFADAGPDNSAFVVGDRPGNGGVPAPPVAITLVSLDLLDGSSFTLDPHETLVLTGGPLYIGPGAVFSGNGIVQGSIINAGLLRIPIVRVQTIAQTTGGYIEVQLPEPAAPGDPVFIPSGGGGFAVGEGTMVSFAGGGGGGQVTPHIVIEGDPAPNDGIIRWDASLEVTGSFEQRETGALRLFIAGNDMPGVNYSQLTVGENVMLAGAIELVFQPELFSEFGYAPTVGETFDLIIADQGITIAATGLTLRSFSTQEGAPLITDLTFSPYDSGIAADPDHLFQIGETVFRLDLVENDTILRATLIHPVNLVPEPSTFALGLLAGVVLLVSRRRWRR